MRNIILVFITFVSLVFLGCTDNEQKEDNRKVIKVGTSGGYYPFTFFEKDKLQGFEIDVWNAIGKNLDSRIEFKTAKFSGLFGMLETGKIDTISNQITMTAKRVARYDFTIPYVYDGAQIIVHEDTDNINSLNDLKGKKIGVGLGTNYAEIIKEFDINNEIEVVSYEGNGFQQDVKLERIAAYIEDRTSAVEAIKKGNLPLKLVGQPIRVLANSFPFIKNEKNAQLLNEINGALKKLREDGTLTKISMKWFNTVITSK